MTEDDCGDLATVIISVLVCVLIGAAIIGFVVATRSAHAAQCLTRMQAVRDGGHPRYHVVDGRRCWYAAGRRRHAEAAAAPLPGGERADPPAEVAIDQDPWHDPVWRGEEVLPKPTQIDPGPLVAEVIADRFVAAPPATSVPAAPAKASPSPPPRNLLGLLGLLLLAGATAFGASVVVYDWWSEHRFWRAGTAVVRVPPPVPPVPVERPDELQRARGAPMAVIVDLPSASAAALRAVMR